MTEGRFRRAYLGIAGDTRPLPPRLAPRPRPTDGASRWSQVVPRAAPPTAPGLRPEDLIVEVDGGPVGACRRPPTADGGRADRPRASTTRAPPAGSRADGRGRPGRAGRVARRSDAATCSGIPTRTSRSPASVGRGGGAGGDPCDRRRRRGGVRRRMAHPPARRDAGRPRVRGAGLYLGGAGVVDALRRLAERGLVGLRRDYVSRTSRALEPDEPGPELMLGETGILLVRQRLSPSAANAARLRELVAANVGHEAPRAARGQPGDDARRDASSASTISGRRPPSGSSPRATPRPASGSRTSAARAGVYLGAAHGFAGCVLALGEVDGAAETARRYAVVEDGLANWPPLTPTASSSATAPIRVQWCHGAPGMITVARATSSTRSCALAGGELTWRAGPLAKGRGPLPRHRRERLRVPRPCSSGPATSSGSTGLASSPSTRSPRSSGRAPSTDVGRHTLWTGDLGVALYLADCIDGAGRRPLPTASVSAQSASDGDATTPAEHRSRSPASRSPRRS